MPRLANWQERPVTLNVVSTLYDKDHSNPSTPLDSLQKPACWCSHQHTACKQDWPTPIQDLLRLITFYFLLQERRSDSRGVIVFVYCVPCTAVLPTVLWCSTSTCRPYVPIPHTYYDTGIKTTSLKYLQCPVIQTMITEHVLFSCPYLFLLLWHGVSQAWSLNINPINSNSIPHDIWILNLWWHQHLSNVIMKFMCDLSKNTTPANQWASIPFHFSLHFPSHNCQFVHFISLHFSYL